MTKRAAVPVEKAVGEAAIAPRRILGNENLHPAGAEALIEEAVIEEAEAIRAVRAGREETDLQKITAIKEINATKMTIMKERQGRQNTLLLEHRSTISTDFKIV